MRRSLSPSLYAVGGVDEADRAVERGEDRRDALVGGVTAEAGMLPSGPPPRQTAETSRPVVPNGRIQDIATSYCRTGHQGLAVRREHVLAINGDLHLTGQ